MVCETEFEYISPFTKNGVAWAWKDGKAGLINEKLEYVTESVFLDIGNFSENGLAAACIENGKCGYINEKGEFVIEPQFLDADEFENGFAMVLKDGMESRGNYRFIDEKGNIIHP